MHLHLAVLALALAVPPDTQGNDRAEQEAHRQALNHYQKGQNALSSERMEEAVQEFKAAIQLDPLLTLAYYRLGQIHMSQKEYVQAERVFVACRDAYEKIASMQFTNREDVERRREEEVDQLQNYLGLLQSGQIKNSNPNVPIQVQQQIDALQRNRRKGGADSTNVPAEVSVSLGSAYFRQGKMAEAAKEWKTAAEVNPKLGEAHNNLAAYYLISNQATDAERELKLAEKAGYPVNPHLKDDIKKAVKAGAAPK